ncbi:unnamed protein product [Ectocarpus sp. 4 AP-2014]
MRGALVQAGLLAACAGPSSSALAAVVEASTLATVTVAAPLYDTTVTASDGGCSPTGCIGDNTRDGDATSLESRWSCKPALGDAGSVCRITYGLGIQYQLTGLNIAMYRGDERTRTLEINIDNLPYTVWTSSGTTTDFETIEVDTMGRWIEIVGVLEDSEWLSIMEVEILVDDGVTDTDDVVGTTEVEAGSLGTVTATSAIFDPSLGDSNGCDPAGCTAELTRDGDVSDGSRWSCAPSLGGTCSISYDLGAVYDLSELRLALYKGTTRVRTVDVTVDGSLAITWTSSGTTDGFESVDLSGYSGQDVTVTGVLDASEWLSITETKIMVLSDGVVSPPSPSTTTPAPVFAPVATPSPTPTVPTPEQLFAAKEIDEIGAVTTTATLFDPSLLADNGCDPSGCTAGLTRDGDYATSSRWSCAPKLGGDGDSCTISYDLGQVYNLAQIRLAMYKGDERQVTAEVRVDGALVTTWTSSGTTVGAESILFADTTSGQVVEVTGVLGASEWLSIIETLIYVWPDTAPTPSTAGSTPAPAPVTPVGELTAVGLLPLADCTGCFGEDLPPFHSKDGDFSTSWTCVGGTECTLRFDLFSWRHIKQVKIALPDGAERAVDMRIAGRYNDELAAAFAEAYVTSSGTTDEFETYDFDVFTNEILISGVFTSDSQTISISEVEFMEELQEGEIQISDWDTPLSDARVDGPTTDAFDWTTDSDDAIGRSVDFELASYAMVDAVEIKFPVGNTYKFDLELNDDQIRGEILKTITGFESADTADWQSFDLSQHLDADQFLTEINVVVQGTGSGAPGFAMLDFRVMGTAIDNPTNTVYVGSTFIERWTRLTDRYPDFVAEGTGDQKTIMEAICTVKKASFDGVDCVGGDDAATGTVVLPQGSWYVDGNIFMKSGVFLDGSFSEDSPYFTGIILEEGAAGKTDIDAMVVMDGISNAMTDNIWIRGHYDPDTSNDTPAVPGLGSTGLSVVGSTNITLRDAEIRFLDGDALVVRDSNMISIDAGEYEELYSPWSLASSRGTGLIVDSCDSIYVRRHTLYENGVAGIHVMGTNNFTFDATIGDESTVGEGNVGNLDGQQPIDVVIESSTLVTFNDLRVQSSNDPIMTVSDSTTVSFNNLGLSRVEADACVIQTDDPSTVTIDADEDELTLDGTCYVKV